MVFLAGGLMLSAFAVQARSFTDDQMCERAVSEQRMGRASERQCQCVIGVARIKLGPLVYLQWREAMYLGESRLDAVLDLGIPLRELHARMEEVIAASQRQCGVDLS